MPAGLGQSERESTSELMETESEALKIADSIAELAKSAAGDLQKDGNPEHGGSAATPTPLAQFEQCCSAPVSILFGHPGGYASAGNSSVKNWWRMARPSSEKRDPGSEFGQALGKELQEECG